jgi:hypothetical protein
VIERVPLGGVLAFDPIDQGFTPIDGSKNPVRIVFGQFFVTVPASIHEVVDQNRIKFFPGNLLAGSGQDPPADIGLDAALGRALAALKDPG